MLPLGAGGVYTSWFQFSRTRDSVLPTHFGQRYQDDLKRGQECDAAVSTPMSPASAWRADGRSVDHLDVATLTPRGAASASP